MPIPQLIPTITKKSKQLLNDLIDNPKHFNSNLYTSDCEKWLSKNIYNNKPVFLTTSGTRALELIAAAIDIEEGDEIIFPSYTFVGTANPFVLYGAKPIFLDVLEETLGLDYNLLEKAITSKTKAIVVVHYNGIGANMEKIIAFSKKHKLLLIEDNAQGFMCKYNNKYLGSFADFSILSFNYTKNIQCGEGGALVVNNSKYLNDIEKIYHLGTNRIDFQNKKVSHYEWVSKGSKFYPSQLEAAVLLPQLEMSYKILEKRKQSWDLYFQLLSKNETIRKQVLLPVQIPSCEHTGHIFYLRLKNEIERNKIISYLQACDIQVFPHYHPLHLSKFGKAYGRSFGGQIAEKISHSLIRLPLYSTISKKEIKTVVSAIEAFFLA